MRCQQRVVIKIGRGKLMDILRKVHEKNYLLGAYLRYNVFPIFPKMSVTPHWRQDELQINLFWTNFVVCMIVPTVATTKTEATNLCHPSKCFMKTTGDKDIIAFRFDDAWFFFAVAYTYDMVDPIECPI